MSTSKHIDKICIAVIAVTLVLAILFMNAAKLGVSAADKELGYESRLFKTGTVHSVDIVMNDWDSFIASCESEEYSSCTVVIDGEKYGNIGIRAKGNTSLSSVSAMGSQRYSFKLEFDQYESGRSYHGLDKLCLNNIIQDNTMMKDYIVYQMMAQFGVDSPLCSYVYITVNGEDWGLYLAVEGVEDSFLERNYSSEGELYKPDSMSVGGGRGNGQDFNMNDFLSEASGENGETGTTNGEAGTSQTTGENGTGNDTDTSGEASSDGSSFAFNPGDFSQNGTMPDMSQFGDFSQNGTMPDMSQFGNFSGQMPQGDFSQFAAMGGMGGMGSSDVKLQYIDDDPDSYSNIFSNAKTDITNKDKERLISSLKNLSEYSNLEDTLDMEEVLRYFVIHNYVCNGDSYTGSIVHNYYLYENDGQLSMIPWDYNLAFGGFQAADASSTINESIDSPVANGSVDDRPMVGWIFSDEEYTEAYHEIFAEFIEEWYNSGKLEQLIENTADEIRSYVEKDPTKFCTLEEFDTGVSALLEFVSLRTEAVSRQLSGDDTAVDASGLNLSDMGSMNGSMGGGAMPGNMPQMGDASMPQNPNAGSSTAGNDSTAAAGGEADASQASGDSVTQMPDAAISQSSDGSMPQMPDGTMPQVGDGSMPQMPDGTMPQMGDGSMPQMPDGTMPQVGDGSMPQMPEGTMPQMGAGTAQQSSGAVGASYSGQSAAVTLTSSSTGKMPNMPAGGGQFSAPPNMGDGSQMPSMPEGAEGMPDFSQITSAASSDSSAEADGSGQSAPAAAGGQFSFSMPSNMTGMTGNGAVGQGNSTVSTLILLGASVLSLAVGLLIVILKKY